MAETSPDCWNRHQFRGWESRQPGSAELWDRPLSFHMFVWFSCCLLVYSVYSILMVAYSIDLQELLQVAVTDFIAGFAAAHHILTHLSKTTGLFRIAPCAARILAVDPLLFPQRSHKWDTWVDPKEVLAPISVWKRRFRPHILSQIASTWPFCNPLKFLKKTC